MRTPERPIEHDVFSLRSIAPWNRTLLSAATDIGACASLIRIPNHWPLGEEEDYKTTLPSPPVPPASESSSFSNSPVPAMGARTEIHGTISNFYTEVDAGAGWPDGTPEEVRSLKPANPDGTSCCHQFFCLLASRLFEPANLGPWTSEGWPLRLCDLSGLERSPPPLDPNPKLEGFDRHSLDVPEAPAGQPQQPPRGIQLTRPEKVDGGWLFSIKQDQILADVSVATAEPLTAGSLFSSNTGGSPRTDTVMSSRRSPRNWTMLGRRSM